MLACALFPEGNRKVSYVKIASGLVWLSIPALFTVLILVHTRFPPLLSDPIFGTGATGALRRWEETESALRFARILTLGIKVAG